MAAPVIYPSGAINDTPPNGFIPLQGTSPQTSQVLVTSGTFLLNGATGVTVVAPNLTATSQILISLNKVGGTVGALPVVQTVTPGTGFTILGTASDTSTYNYLILG
jgi:hypothetical protein